MAFCEEKMEYPRLIRKCRLCGETMLQSVRQYVANSSEPIEKFEVKEALDKYFDLAVPLLSIHNCSDGRLGVLEPIGVNFPESDSESPNFLQTDESPNDITMIDKDGKISIVDHEKMIRRVRNGNAQFMADLLFAADDVNELPVKKLIFLKRNIRRFIEEQKRVDLISDAIEGDPGEAGEEEAFKEYRKTKRSLKDVLGETEPRFMETSIDINKIEEALLFLRRRAVHQEGFDPLEWDALGSLMIPFYSEKEKDDNSD